MDPNFLHVGNYLEVHGQVCEVLSISVIPDLPFIVTVKPLNRPDIEYHYAEISELSPIELDYEWITKLGVAGQGINGISVKPMHSKPNIWGVYFHNKMGVCYLGKDVQYVHELQNVLEVFWNKKIKIDNE